ncbi:MAG: DMT family transporter [Vicinamibacteria bacterium]
MSKRHAPHTPLEWFLLAAPGLIWGASFLFIAEGLTAMPPNGITFLRILIGFATLSVVPAVRRPVPREDWSGIFWVGLLWMAFPLSMFPFAEQRISSALTGMLNGANPLFVVIVAAFMARAWPSRQVLRGLVVGGAGAVLIALPGLDDGHSSVTGILLVIAALASYGIALNLAGPLQQRSGGLPVIWRALGVALVLTAPLGLPDLLGAHWTSRAVFSMLALGALGTAVAQVLMVRAAGLFGASTASGTTFLIPVVALALGVIVRGESVSPVSVLGCAVCLAGAWLISRP